MTWIICLLHTNELPLRNFFKIKDGNTEGPSQFAGPIGRIITNKSTLKERSLINFKAIDAENLPEVDVKSLSRDQQYLHQMFTAIKTGIMTDSLFKASLPTVHHARFMNLASAILRYYVTEPKPTKELLDVVNFIMKVIIFLKNTFLIFLSLLNLFSAFHILSYYARFVCLSVGILGKFYCIEKKINLAYFKSSNLKILTLFHYCT